MRSNTGAAALLDRLYIPREQRFERLGSGRLGQLFKEVAQVTIGQRAIIINIEIMRAFVKLRDLLSSNRELARRFAQLETRLDKKLTEHDEAIAAILSAIRQLMGETTH